MITPFRDFEGNSIWEGDTLRYPDGTQGVVRFMPDRLNPWRLLMPDGNDLALALQIGDRGQAVKINSHSRCILAPRLIK